MLGEHDIMGDVQIVSLEIKTLIPFVRRTISKK